MVTILSWKDVMEIVLVNDIFKVSDGIWKYNEAWNIVSSYSNIKTIFLLPLPLVHTILRIFFGVSY